MIQLGGNEANMGEIWFFFPSCPWKYSQLSILDQLKGFQKTFRTTWLQGIIVVQPWYKTEQQWKTMCTCTTEIIHLTIAFGFNATFKSCSEYFYIFIVLVVTLYVLGFLFTPKSVKSVNTSWLWTGCIQLSKYATVRAGSLQD